MTKLRPPLSIEDALDRVAGVVRWERIAELAGREARTVRRWGDPDELPAAADAISLGLARKLDAAYRGAGGEGSPLLQCLALQLDLEIAAETADDRALGRLTGAVAKEAGEAVAAAIAAAAPGSCHRTRANAELQLQECSAAITNALAALRARAGRPDEAQP